MHCIYKTLEITTVSELNDGDYFILLEEEDILRKTKDGYDLEMINYDKKVTYQKITNVEAKSINSGDPVEVDPDRLVQRVKILTI